MNPQISQITQMEAARQEALSPVTRHLSPALNFQPAQTEQVNSARLVRQRRRAAFFRSGPMMAC